MFEAPLYCQGNAVLNNDEREREKKKKVPRDSCILCVSPPTTTQKKTVRKVKASKQGEREPKRPSPLRHYSIFLRGTVTAVGDFLFSAMGRAHAGFLLAPRIAKSITSGRAARPCPLCLSDALERNLFFPLHTVATTACAYGWIAVQRGTTPAKRV